MYLEILLCKNHVSINCIFCVDLELFYENENFQPENWKENIRILPYKASWERRWPCHSFLRGLRSRKYSLLNKTGRSTWKRLLLCSYVFSIKINVCLIWNVSYLILLLILYFLLERCFRLPRQRLNAKVFQKCISWKKLADQLLGFYNLFLFDLWQYLNLIVCSIVRFSILVSTFF